MADKFKPAKRGSEITFVTGSRFGRKEHQGTVVAFVPKGMPAKVSAKSGLHAEASNRDRYIVQIGEAVRFANAKAVK